MLRDYIFLPSLKKKDYEDSEKNLNFLGFDSKNLSVLKEDRGSV